MRAWRGVSHRFDVEDYPFLAVLVEDAARFRQATELDARPSRHVVTVLEYCTY